MNKDCPSCGTSQPKEELRVCGCSEIICTDEQCKIEHLLTAHLTTRPLDDEDWEEID